MILRNREEREQMHVDQLVGVKSKKLILSTKEQVIRHPNPNVSL